MTENQTNQERKKQMNTKRIKNIATPKRIHVSWSDDPDTRACIKEIRLRCEHRRLKDTLAEKYREIALYRSALNRIRDIVLFGNTSEECQKARIAKTKPECRHEMGRLLAVQNLSYRALNWRESETQ
jgi:hypothetical protein